MHEGAIMVNAASGGADWCVYMMKAWAESVATLDGSNGDGGARIKVVR